MPQLPGLVADWMARRFSRDAQVVHAELVGKNSRLCRLRFRWQNGRFEPFLPGQHVEVRISRGVFRHYTVSRQDQAAGWFELLVYLHNKGPGSRWAEACKPGQVWELIGPGGSLRLQECEGHIFLGDETTLGLFAAFAQSAQAGVSGAIEHNAESPDYPRLLDLPLSAVYRSAEAPSPLITWVQDNLRTPEPAKRVYLAGKAQTIIALRQALLQLGWTKTQLRTATYWNPDKVGL